MPPRDRVLLARPEPSPVARIEVFALDELMARPDLMEKPPAVIPRVLYRERATLYAAREKMGKTTFATAAVAAVSRGTPFLDAPTRRVPVLWLTEEHLGDPTRRLVEMGADPEWVHVGMLPHAGSPEERVEQIAATVRDRDFAVLVIDTLSVLMRGLRASGDANDAGSVMQPLVNIAHEEGVSLLLLHHANKSTGGYRDSTEIGARVDVIVEMREGTLAYQRKLAVKGRYGVEDFEVSYDAVTGLYTLGGGELSLDMRVRDYVIQNIGCTAAAIEAEMGGARVTVQATVRRLVQAGRIVDRPEQQGRRTTHRFYPVLAEGAATSGE